MTHITTGVLSLTSAAPSAEQIDSLVIQFRSLLESVVLLQADQSITSILTVSIRLSCEATDTPLRHWQAPMGDR